MGSSTQIFLKIGEVAAQSGVPIKTIRYYEQLGLLTIAHRTEGNFRLFNESAISRLAFIKRLQALGLSLQEIGECLTIYDDGCLPCENIQQKLQERVTKIDRQVTELIQLRGELTNLLQEWSLAPNQQDGIICPNLEV
ncbi:heavy metal-responsive transcriptional regulator [Roseofilum casamattae]|uniref:Heavy metal-responsive transcriptional regulator n=1 Tax=Roseofilum casamattae BLCC-M143 TaxID=3022442 RepID=A0ABT7BT50_9CYAN|nr:heavy metal-responsive transcriptional regulator [Roseofilum casamattae]MDJ1182358.1 heavy metal-responsive transcriptional regulator [Roseofilum casamattae BLCC-M143]